MTNYKPAEITPQSHEANNMIERPQSSNVFQNVKISRLFQAFCLTMILFVSVLTVSVQSASASPVKNGATGLCLDGDRSGYVYTKDCNGGGYQNWNFRKNGSNWVFRSEATALCLDSDKEASVYGKECNNGGYQNWDFNNGKYRNAATGLCLDSDNNRAVYAYGCADRHAGQKWYS